MGIVLDSSVIVATERTGRNPRQVIEEIAARFGDTEATLSAITVVELAHGIERADSAARREARERFLNELLTEISVEPVTTQIGIRAGRIDGSLQAKGLKVALGDLLIGTTALELGYSVVTHNLRHFEMIPGRAVRRL